VCTVRNTVDRAPSLSRGLTPAVAAVSIGVGVAIAVAVALFESGVSSATTTFAGFHQRGKRGLFAAALGWQRLG